MPLLALLASVAIAQQSVTPPRAEGLLDNAVAQAKQQKKHVFLAFHASWCGWCHRLEKFLDDPKIKPVIERRLIVLWLDGQEHDDKKNLENPGVDAVMKRFGATEAGLPSMHVLDGEGKLVATSIRKEGGNIGYPAQADEIAHFRQMLTAAEFTPSELDLIESELKARAAKIK